MARKHRLLAVRSVKRSGDFVPDVERSHAIRHILQPVGHVNLISSGYTGRFQA